jgi:2'-5' RNA ligase
MRAFIAVDASNTGAISRVQNEMLSVAGWNPKEVKQVEPQNFHFTIIFLGDITEQQADRIKSRMSEVHFEPFDLIYKGVGAFPNSQSARIIWIGVDSEGGEKLASVANSVVSGLSELGFRPDKAFSPHLTIFRMKTRRPLRLAGIVSKFENATLGTDLIAKVHLKKSELTASGPIYSNVYTVEAKK